MIFRVKQLGILTSLISVIFCAYLLSVNAQDFRIVTLNKTADIHVSANDHTVVRIAAQALVDDIDLITDKRPNLVTRRSVNSIVIGTLGNSVEIDQLVKDRKLDVSKIRGKRESYLITTVSGNLVIVGSDRRGTAYGVFELSQRLGVSPWVWWADVLPEKRKTLSISAKNIVGKEPSVKYRGIFLNDEDWGLLPWAAKTFEPESGDVGPKTYAKIFELLLRLKANTLWPAMHEVTRAFNSFRENPKVADDYAIVMGSSHAEPMLRSNTTEWKADKNDFNFVSNPQGVTAYWEERARENGKFENIYTIGMRGIHDSPLIGTKSQAERIPLLEKIFGVQRGLITKHTGKPAEMIPQIFCPYKEVLADYRAGLKVPDDVTIVFPDDNFGYIRQFPTAEERKRKGGFGVYYHISYLGRPLSYLWLNTTPPSLIWQEMSKAYENGMRDLWIVNVGDIKPGEIGMEFFLQMAYDADRWSIDTQHLYLREWAKREFGEKHSTAIADVLNKYYRLGFQRKPEHLQWFLPTETPKRSDLTEAEALARLDAYADLRTKAESISSQIPDARKDAFFQLVLYPVRSATLANERFFSAELANTYKQQWPATAHEFAKRSIAADAAIAAETRYFNETLAGGKWRHTMSVEMGKGQWPSMRSTPPKISLDDFPPGGSVKPVNVDEPGSTATDFPNSSAFFGEFQDSVSIDAENYQNKTERAGFGWRVITGLGKTGDSVAVFPNAAHSFADLRRDSPSLEYDIVVDGGEYSIEFYLLPTQPLVTGNGLRLAFAIDNGEPQIVIADKDTEVSSRKWAQNILDQNTRATAKITIPSGHRKLRIFAIDTGVVLDKIVISKGSLPTSYFGPTEMRFLRTKK